MKLTNTCLFLSAMSAMVVGLASAAFAATDTKTFEVKATVLKACTIDASGVTFTGYNPISGAGNTANGTVSVTCTKNAVTPIALGMGDNASSEKRRMKMTKDGADYFLSYELRQPASAGSVLWGNGTVGGATYTPDAAPSKDRRDFTVSGIITPVAGEDPTDGTYTDNVVATVNF